MGNDGTKHKSILGCSFGANTFPVVMWHVRRRFFHLLSLSQYRTHGHGRWQHYLPVSPSIVLWWLHISSFSPFLSLCAWSDLFVVVIMDTPPCNFLTCFFLSFSLPSLYPLHFIFYILWIIFKVEKIVRSKLRRKIVLDKLCLILFQKMWSNNNIWV